MCTGSDAVLSPLMALNSSEPHCELLACCFSADGSTLVGAAVGGLFIWKRPSDAPELIKGESVRAVAFCHHPDHGDGRYLYSAAGDAIVLIDCNTGLQMSRGEGAVRAPSGRGERILSLEVSPDGRYVIWGTETGAVRCASTETGHEVLSVKTLTPYSPSCQAICLISFR